MSLRRLSYVVEYSPSQKAFHIQRLDNALGSNQRRFRQKGLEMYDWVPLFIGTRKQCDLMILQSERMRQQEKEGEQWIN